MPRTVIFDLDGTLVDTPKGIVKTFLAVLKEMGYDAVNPDAVRETIGMPLEKAFGDLLGMAASSPLVTQAIKQYQALFKEIVLPNAKSLVFEDVDIGLQSLRERGISLAIATSKIYASAESLLKAAGLMDYFDIVLGADQVKNRKPDPEMGLMIMSHLKSVPEETIMVGDTTHDLLMGKEAGMKTIAVTYGVHDVDLLESAGPTKIVHHFSDVVSEVELMYGLVG